MADAPIVLGDVKRLNARPGDVLVFRYDGNLTDEQRAWFHDHITHTVRELCGDGVGFLLLTDGMRLDQVVTPGSETDDAGTPWGTA